MNQAEAQRYHQLYGVKNKRVTYMKSDFLDYVFMICICALVLYYSYGFENVLTKVGLVLCAIMVFAFPLRHGIEFKVPLILRRPQDIIYMVVYRLTNIEPVILVAAGVILIENLLIYMTPQLPHHVDLVRDVAFYLIYIHFAIITIYRTVILVAHLVKKGLVREVLMETPWKRTVAKKPGVIFEIFYSYFTGLLSHLMMLIPWFLVVSYLNFSLIFLPIICIVNYLVFQRSTGAILRWYYRDHWLGHNSELDFVYLHGAHHDAIPSALLAADESGYLEGVIRQALGRPIALFNPIMACVYYTKSVWGNVTGHQYIPGIYPKATVRTQHAIHHYGKLEPYGLPFNLETIMYILPEKEKAKFEKMTERQKDAYRLDEILTGFKWDNSKFRWYLQLVKKYNAQEYKKRSSVQDSKNRPSDS
ncbi:hypothetical protein [Serratia proteamaculans]|jgi:hypothetical protein